MPAPFVTPAQLIAIPATERYDGMPMLVRVSANLTGWVEFVASSTEANNPPLVYAPTAGAGRYHWIDNRQISPFFGLVDAASVDINGRLSSNFRLNMTAGIVTRAIADPTNLSDGQELRIRVKQPTSPPSGGCKVTFGGIRWRFTGNNTTIKSGANDVSIIQSIYDQELDLLLTSIVTFG